MPANFSYILPGRLAGMARPGVERPLAADLRFLRAEGIGAVVSLPVTPIDEAAVTGAGLGFLHLPVADFTPPSPEYIDRFVRFVRERNDAGEAVAVHCTAGLGRTGTLLACFLVAEGLPPDDAIARIRRERPGSVETPEQEEAVRSYAGRLRPTDRES